MDPDNDLFLNKSLCVVCPKQPYHKTHLGYALSGLVMEIQIEELCGKDGNLGLQCVPGDSYDG